MKQLLILFCLCLALESCVFLDTTEGSNLKECPVHSEKLEKTLVKTAYGYVCPDDYNRDYPFAKRVMWLGCVVDRTPMYRFALMFTCRECDEVKRRVKNRNPSLTMKELN